MCYLLNLFIYIVIYCSPQAPFVRAAAGTSSEERDSYLGIRVPKYNN